MSKKNITIDEVKRIAKLSKLEISDSDLNYYAEEMDKIINSYSEHFLDKAFNYIKDNAIVYDEIYRHSKSLKSSLNSEILITSYNQMKEENKNFILIIEVGESNWFSYDNQIKIHELCEQTGVPEDKIVYITNDVMCDVVYDKWFTTQTKYKIKINHI